MNINESPFTAPGSEVRDAGAHLLSVAPHLWRVGRRRDAVRLWGLGVWYRSVARARGW